MLRAHERLAVVAGFMNEHEVLHDFAVVQNRGNTVHPLLTAHSVFPYYFRSAFRACGPGCFGERPAEHQNLAVGFGLHDYSADGGHAL